MKANFRTYDLAVAFNRRCQTFNLKWHLKDQLSRAAASIVLNLAEGAGRHTNPDRRRFYSIALGSLRECQAILDIAPISNHELAESADKLGAHIFCLMRACRC